MPFTQPSCSLHCQINDGDTTALQPFFQFYVNKEANDHKFFGANNYPSKNCNFPSPIFGTTEYLFDIYNGLKDGLALHSVAHG